MNFYILCAFLISSAAVLDGQKMGRSQQRSNPPTCFHKYEDTSTKRRPYVAGILVDKKLVSAGLYSTSLGNVIITTANPIERYLTHSGPAKTEYIDRDNRIEVYDLTGYRCRRYEVLGYSANISNRNSSWIKMGFSHDHSPIHDIIFIIINKRRRMARLSGFRRFIPSSNMPLYIIEIKNYVDKGNTIHFELKETETIEELLVDCDEWIPRAWGRFICIKDVDDRHEIPSGAALVYFYPHKHVLDYHGFGSFALTKGKESILVFTDYSYYYWVAKKHSKRLFRKKKP